MNEWKLFFGFFLDTVRSVPKNAAAVLFAILSTIFSFGFFGSLFETGGPFEPEHDSILHFLETHLTILILPPIFILISVFGESGLILSISNRKDSLKEIATRSRRAAPKLLSLDILFIAFLATLIVILSLPAELSSGNKTLSNNLLFLGGLVFVPIAILAFFIRIYSAFYIILSGLLVKESVNLAYKLFSRTIATSIVFGTISILVTIFLSLLANLIFKAILLIHFATITHVIVAIGFLLFYQTFLFLVQKGAWLSFFRFLATPKEPATIETSQEDENVIQQELPQGNA